MSLMQFNPKTEESCCYFKKLTINFFCLFFLSNGFIEFVDSLKINAYFCSFSKLPFLTERCQAVG